MGMLLWFAAGSRGDEEMIENLISSYSDVININIQDKVSIEYCIMIMNVLFLLYCNYCLIVLWISCLI